MATENSNYDPLRNPQVDYDRTDLSPRGILFFLIGLLLCGVFIELVVWGDVPLHGGRATFCSRNRRPNPMAATQQVPEQPAKSARYCRTLRRSIWMFSPSRVCK